MIKDFQSAAVWISVILAGWLIDYISDPARSILVQISPASLFRLSSDHWTALSFTLLASLLAWTIARTGGYILGNVVGIAIVQADAHKWLKWVSRSVSQGYNVIYIIPLVLTLSLSYTLLMYYAALGTLPRWMVLLGSIAISGLALGGYQVFISISNAVKRAGDERLFLAKTLFSRAGRLAPGVTNAHLRSATVATRLADFEIRTYVNALQIAFHLAVVGVIILETITPGLYELILPQGGVVPTWAGGVGRLILTAQQNNQFQDIAGLLWAIVIFDGFVVLIIDLHAQRKWLKYHGALS